MTGQRKILIQAFNALVQKRSVWRIGKVLWLNFRDPAGAKSNICAFCTSAGLLTNAFQRQAGLVGIPQLHRRMIARWRCRMTAPSATPTWRTSTCLGRRGDPNASIAWDGNSTRGPSSIRGLPSAPTTSSASN